MRISELFGDRQLVLNSDRCKDIEVFKSDDSYCEDYLPGTLNSLTGSRRFLDKIFEDQNINYFGIYIIKIYQESVWKYIVIDDFIPAKKS